MSPLWLLLAVPPVLATARASRGAPPRRARLAALLRAATITLVAIAASDPTFQLERTGSSTAFVLDVSASVRGPEGLQKIKALAANLAPTDLASVVLAAGHARVLLPSGVPARIAALEPATVAAVGSLGEGTDLARGLRLAEATLTTGLPGRIVLLSDGRETEENVRDEATRLRARGLVVDVVPLPEKAPRDAWVVSVSTGSPVVAEGEGLLVRVEVAASVPCRARVTLTRDGLPREDWSREIELPCAPVVFRDRAFARGLHFYRALIETAGDEEPANDQAFAVVLVRGGPRALVIETADEGTAIATILASQGFAVSRTSPDRAPGRGELEALDLVVLASAPLVPGLPGGLAPDRARALERFVREGGGLLALGGTGSYGPGGWRGSELEEALPVLSSPDGQGERPSVAIVLAIDKSGSMNGPKLELAKLAARNAVSVLGPDDQLGVIAFNWNAYWIVPLAPVGDKRAVQEKIQMQAAGGGTDLMPSLRCARAALEPALTRVKHFLVLTDGIAGDGDAVCAYAGELAAQGITTSTVAVGDDADQELLQKIAAAGKGRHHSAARISDLPRIVLEETLAAAQRAMEEAPFRVIARRGHGVLAGIELERLPALHGLDRTQARPLATVVLEGPRGLPLLALWEHGLGRSAAWTSDATTCWAGDLVSSDGGRQLLLQLARHLARREGAEGVAVDLDALPRGKGALVRAEARRTDGSFASDLALTAVLRSAGGEARAPFELVAPGRYEAHLEDAPPGASIVEARLGEVRVAVAGFARGPDPEHARSGADEEALRAIALAGGGACSPIALARPGSTRETFPFGDVLYVLAALLLPIEIAVRRLGR